MDELPTPDFDEYFSRLAGSPMAPALTPELPIETSRGCWWGERSHCTFCGLNGQSMAFRAKSADRVVVEIQEQARRYGILDFIAVDNIMAPAYLDALFPRLQATGMDLRLFYEVKANLTRPQLVALRRGGVRRIQPGIESLSTSILQLMGKGVTALQNLRLLKWCRELDIDVDWNLIYGLPGEAPAEYARMADLLPALVHLAPPRLVRLVVDRFSPYYDAPQRHGLVVEGPRPHLRLLFDLPPALLAELTPSFEHSYVDRRDPSSYVQPLRARIEEWALQASANRAALCYRRGAGFLTITDRRVNQPPTLYQLDGWEAEAFLACDDGRTVAGIASACGRREDEVGRFLDDLVARRLVYEESGRFLSLAPGHDAALALACTPDSSVTGQRR